MTGLEGLGVPQLHGIDGHHIIVAIYEHGFGVGIDDLLAIDDGVALGGHHLALVGAGGEDELAPPLGALHHILLVLALGADGGDAQKGEQFFQKTFLIFFNKLFGFHNYRFL